MSRRLVFGGIGFLLLLSPFMAAAETVAEIQARLQVLLTQIAALQGQGTQAGSGALGGYCPVLTRTLQRGSRDSTTGGQVTELQKFLAARYNVPPTTIVTGYFGPITAQHVIRFQSEQGISPIGIVGPQTRAAIMRVCRQTTISPVPPGPVPPTEPVTFAANLPTGQAPLSVTFTIRIGNASSNTYYVDFGDSSTGLLSYVSCSSSGGQCTPTYTASHTYNGQGSYVAKLKRGNSGQGDTVATVAIYVTGVNIGANFSVNPDAGPAPLTVAFRVPSGDEQSFTVNFGDGTSAAMGIIEGGAARGISHTYSSKGNYVATLMKKDNCNAPLPGTTCSNDHYEIGRRTVNVDSPAGPVITALNTQDPSPGVSVTITGTGFLASNDILLDGTAIQTNVGSTDNGTKIIFVVPSSIATGATDHQLKVRNVNGTSNPVVTRVRPTPASVTLSANGLTDLAIAAGGNYTLAYSSANATSCTMQHANSSGIGSFTVTPNTQGSTGTGLIGYYSLSCLSSDGRAAVKTVSIRATPPPDSSPAGAPTVSITSNNLSDITIAAGGNYPIAHSSSNATSCSMTYVDSTGSHAYAVTPNTPFTTSSGLVGYYTLSCSNASGISSKSLIIRLTPPANVTL